MKTLEALGSGFRGGNSGLGDPPGCPKSSPNAFRSLREVIATGRLLRIALNPD